MLLQSALHDGLSPVGVARPAVLAMTVEMLVQPADDALLRRLVETICIDGIRRSCSEYCTVFEAAMIRLHLVD